MHERSVFIDITLLYFWGRKIGASGKNMVTGFILLSQTLTFAVLSQTTGVVTCCEIETGLLLTGLISKKGKTYKNETNIPTS